MTWQQRARLFVNPRAAGRHPYGGAPAGVLDEAGFGAAWAEIRSWPGYARTPLVPLPGLAGAAGLGGVLYKDEAGRFGLGSFKALGGAYAVARLLAREVAVRTGAAVTTADLTAGRHLEATRGITVTCATDGNHGRSVAWGARTFGCRCVIYVHATVSEGRRRAIERFGAEVRRTPGNYDDSVRQAARDAAANGWFVVSDTSYEGYTDVPRDVMHGYTVMAEEAIRQLPPGGGPPSHVFVQGGVGGVAAAVCARFWQRLGPDRPRLIVVEPERADCLYQSARAGRRTPASGDADSIMAGLACGEASLLAWEVLETGADAFMTVPDDSAADLMRRLAAGTGGDPPLVAGESAVAGLAGALAAMADPKKARALGLGPASRVLVFGTEGATDPELYARIVGRPAEEVGAATP